MTTPREPAPAEPVPRDTRRGPRRLYAVVIVALVVEIVLLRVLTVHFR